MTLFRSLSVQWLATVYVAGFSMLLTIFLARLFGPEVFGEYSYIVTFASLFAIFQDGGFRTLLFREFTSSNLTYKNDDLFSKALGHLLVFTILGIVIVLLFHLPNIFAISLAIVAFDLGTATQFISSSLKGTGKFYKEALWRITVRSLTGLGVVLSVFFIAPQPAWVFFGWIAGSFLALTFQQAHSLKAVSITKPSVQIYRSLGALIIIDIATLIYFKIDILMLRHLGGTLPQVGFYAAASRILEGLVLLLLPFMNVLFRDLRLKVTQPRNFIQLMNKLMIYACLLAILITPLGMFFGESIVTICFGLEYQKGTDILFWLFIAIIFMVPNLVLTQSALSTNQESFYAAGACIAALLNIVLNFFLIPIFGAKGAAIGTIATEGFLFFFIGYVVYSWYWKRKYLNAEQI